MLRLWLVIPPQSGSIKTIDPEQTAIQCVNREPSASGMRCKHVRFADKAQPDMWSTSHCFGAPAIVEGICSHTDLCACLLFASGCPFRPSAVLSRCVSFGTWVARLWMHERYCYSILKARFSHIVVLGFPVPRPLRPVPSAM